MPTLRSTGSPKDDFSGDSLFQEPVMDEVQQRLAGCFLAYAVILLQPLEQVNTFVGPMLGDDGYGDLHELLVSSAHPRPPRFKDIIVQFQ
jgi:hypothetical protein